MTSTTYGIDVSEFQKGLSLRSVHRQGYRFGYAKITEGQAYRDSEFENFRADAESIGLLFAAYHFLRSDSAPEAQAENFLDALPDQSIPCVVDVEQSPGSNPGVPHLAGFHRHLRARGYHAAVSAYYPWWWWTRTGSRKLPALHALFASSYGGNPAGHGAEIYPGNNDVRWQGYGGMVPTILQFGSRGIVDGFSGGVDVDAYRGSVHSLAKLGIFKDYRHKTQRVSDASEHHHAETPQHSHPLAARVHRLETRVNRIERTIRNNG